MKFALFEFPGEKRITGGTVAHLSADQKAALAQIREELRNQPVPKIVGHRVVHGGPKYSEPTAVTEDVMADLRQLAPLAPNHLPQEVVAIETMQNLYPAARHVACFDTAFHRRMPRIAQLYALPDDLRSDGLIQRYGFHGLSYEYIVAELERMGERAGRTVICHLGNGASMAAVNDGQPVDTTMGFTPTSGLVMSTRCGDIDPEAILYFMEKKSMTAAEVRNAITHRSGLLGVSGISSDMQELQAQENSNPRAAEAIALFVYSARKHLGALTAALGGLDRLVFTGGIGENSPSIRARISEDLAPRKLLVIKTNEELMMARHSWNLLGSQVGM